MAAGSLASTQIMRARSNHAERDASEPFEPLQPKDRERREKHRLRISSDFDLAHYGLGPIVVPSELLPAISARIRDNYSFEAYSALRAMAIYVSEFLTRAQPGLGRAGPVCPFAKGAVATDSLLLTACVQEHLSDADLASAVGAVLDLFLLLKARSPSQKNDIFRSAVITFPYVDAKTIAEAIVRAKDRLKLRFVRAGLMIGEFYPGCDVSGLHNAHFKPLDAPIACLAIRHMTPSDAPFMVENPLFVDAFVTLFGEDGRSRLDQASALVRL